MLNHKPHFISLTEEALLNNGTMRKNFLENIIQITNNNLVHYSFSPKGTALYYQKIMLNKIFRARTRTEDFVLDNSKFKTNRQATRYLKLGGPFQQAYYWMVVSNQIRRGVSPLIYSSDSNTVGSFKNISFNRGWTTGSSILKRSQEPKKPHNTIVNGWAYLSNPVGELSFFFIKRFHHVNNTLPMRGKFTEALWAKIFTFTKTVNCKPFFEHMSLTLGSLVHFVRTTWFYFTLQTRNHHNPIDTKDNWGYRAIKSAKTEGHRMLFAADIDYDQAPGAGSWISMNFDLTNDIGVRSKLFRKKLKNHRIWRIGMAFWAKKIWQFKKTYRFWRYMRGMSNIMFRGFYGFSVFMNRLDVYAMRMFMLRNLRFVRVIIKAGHLFYGTYAARNPKIRVTRHSILSLSEEATSWTTKRGYRKFIQDDLYAHKTNAIKNIKNAALRFCRQHKESAIWGRSHKHKFAMFFGENIDVINMDSKRTNFFSLSYAYSQRAITSAWW